MSTDDLRTEMRDGFEKVDQRFKKVDHEFAEVRSEMREGFKRIDERFNGVYGEFIGVYGEFSRVYGEFEKLRGEMKAEGEKTRRHFDVMVERMQESVKLVAEATAHHAVRPDDHELRITRLEDPRRT